ncbi:hypothetical protein OUZ56_028830 [Daphnia magna]|uniref:Uncharacterized protein n=1 Tax=Daphnia magna TaxID=35525 RepID=A0ABR0B517_9CRUS|nr:hypothetical protein OUZ56_028830 [Daphnia magna]
MTSFLHLGDLHDSTFCDVNNHQRLFHRFYKKIWEVGGAVDSSLHKGVELNRDSPTFSYAYYNATRVVVAMTTKKKKDAYYKILCTIRTSPRNSNRFSSSLRIEADEKINTRLDGSKQSYAQ